MSLYVITLGVFFCSDLIFALGLNLQYGMTGILNFAYILFYALGAYVAAAAAIGSQHNALATAEGEKFLFGLNVLMPYPADVIVGALVGAAIAGIIGLLFIRTLKADFGALVTVAVFLVAYTFISDYIPLFNGGNGLSAIPNPFGLLPSYAYLACCAGFTLIAAWVAVSITRSPLGRRMRAVSERPDVVESLGKSVFRTRWVVFVVGNGMAALAGAIVVLFVTGWSPPSWAFSETLNVYAAVIIGGAGSNLGTTVGTLLVSVGVVQGVLFLPQISALPYLVPSLQWVAIGVALIAFIWLRPRGLVPERRQRLSKQATYAGGGRGPEMSVGRQASAERLPG